MWHLDNNPTNLSVLPPVGHINSDVAPAIGNRTFRITAEIDRPSANSQGCLVSYGASTNGLSLYILGDRVVFDYNLFRGHFKAMSDRPVPVGASNVGVAFERLGKNGRGATEWSHLMDRAIHRLTAPQMRDVAAFYATRGKELPRP